MAINLLKVSELDDAKVIGCDEKLTAFLLFFLFLLRGLVTIRIFLWMLGGIHNLRRFRCKNTWLILVRFAFFVFVAFHNHCV